MARTLYAGLLGGLAMFVWSSIAHMATPLGGAGIRELPDDRPVLAALEQQAGNRSGLYIYPSLGSEPDAMERYAARLATSPSGLLVYHPPGQGRVFGARPLVIELLTELLVATMAAWLVARAALVRYAARVGFVLVVGLVAAISTNVSYWNWYGFPLEYTVPYIFTRVVGFLAAGLVIARMLPAGAPRGAPVVRA